MKIEYVQKKPPPAWDRAMCGRLESTQLIMRNLLKVSLDELSPLEKAAELALNVYNSILELEYEPNRDFADLALDACGLVYVMIHIQAGFLSKGIKRCHNDQVYVKDIESTLIDVEAFVLRTVFPGGKSRNGDAIADLRQKIEDCLQRYNGEKTSSRTTIQEAVVNIVAKGLMDFEDMGLEANKTISEKTSSLSDRKRKQKLKRVVEEIPPDNSSKITLSESEGDSSSESGQSETIRAKKGRGKFHTKIEDTLTYYARDMNLTDESVETGTENSGNRKRRKGKNNRASTLFDHHRIPGSLDQYGEVDLSSSHPTTFQPRVHGRRSTTPVPLSPSYYVPGLFNPSLDQILANDIASHVNSTILNSMRMRSVGDDEYENLHRRTKGTNRAAGW